MISDRQGALLAQVILCYRWRLQPGALQRERLHCVVERVMDATCGSYALLEFVYLASWVARTRPVDAFRWLKKYRRKNSRAILGRRNRTCTRVDLPDVKPQWEQPQEMRVPPHC